MAATLVLAAAVERAAAAARHGWGTHAAPDTVTRLADAQAGLHAARLLTPFVTAHTRNQAFRPAELREALGTRGTLIKIRCMRRTLHLWPLDQAVDAHTATLRLRLGSTLATARRHGLAQGDLQHWADHTAAELEAGPLRYRELQDRLAKQHPRASPESLRLGIKWAWESGRLTCRNTASSLHREDRQFALITHAHPTVNLSGTDPKSATVRLVRRYLHAYGPVAEGDLLWWSGLTRAEITPALTALRSETTPVRIDGLDHELIALDADMDTLRAAEPLPTDHVRLLAFEDPAFKGYFTTRARYLDPAHRTRAFNPIGEVRATITIAGRTAGTWAWDKKTRTVRHELFTRLPRATTRAVRQRLDQAQTFLRTEPS
ncbi:DNA glycosylase AlkZ-like family protein [Streptomyces sp. NRRL B-1347]|uniref:DNA glycosylase AlkZ-like family protein n=1 Tax=Streptomyces sp. NRRL B-1347 TaxID=1476877 RepID=UPI0004C5EE8F|nr:crosslink repair DNA glycosylase YcaQ family protein [Streptomyces sp. NRRL B-1347]